MKKSYYFNLSVPGISHKAEEIVHFMRETANEDDLFIFIGDTQYSGTFKGKDIFNKVTYLCYRTSRNFEEVMCGLHTSFPKTCFVISK